MQRPADLPDFTNPPLDEVVLGVQFSPVPGFTTVDVREVWELYRSEFPKVRDQPLLPPSFETFGGVTPQQIGFQPVFLGGQPGTGRVWFISQNENHLIQFQPDRLLANWRKTQNEQPYPRFENIAEAYEANLSKLSIYLNEHFGHAVQINQAEIAYINIIPVNEFSEAEEFFKICKSSAEGFEGINVTAVHVISNSNGQPYARLIQEIQSAFSPDAKRKAYKLTLTFRGKPAGTSIADGLEFFTKGRETIVREFADLTTEFAHDLWGKK